MLTIAITIIAGAAVFGYVDSQAGVSERQYGQSVGQTVAFLSEKFTVPFMSFTSTSATVWLYNSGTVNFQPVQVLFYNSTKSILLKYTASGVTDLNHAGCTAPASNENPQLSAINLQQNGLLQLTLTMPSFGAGCVSYQLKNNVAYYVNVLGYYGNTVTHFEVMGH